MLVYTFTEVKEFEFGILMEMGFLTKNLVSCFLRIFNDLQAWYIDSSLGWVV